MGCEGFLGRSDKYIVRGYENTDVGWAFDMS